MSRDLNISLLLNCFYLTEYCQVSAKNLIELIIGQCKKMFSPFSFYPSPLIFVFDIWALYKFLIYCNVIYFFSKVLCAMSSYFIFFHKTWQNAPVFKLIVSACLMNYVVKGLYLHSRILNSLRKVEPLSLTHFYLHREKKQIILVFFVFNKLTFCVGSILQIHEI